MPSKVNAMRGYVGNHDLLMYRSAATAIVHEHTKTKRLGWLKGPLNFDRYEATLSPSDIAIFLGGFPWNDVSRGHILIYSREQQLEMIYRFLATRHHDLRVAFPEAFFVNVLDMIASCFSLPDHPITQVMAKDRDFTDECAWRKMYIAVEYENYAHAYRTEGPSRGTLIPRIIAQNVLDAYPWGRMRLRVTNRILASERPPTSDAILGLAGRILDMDKVTRGFIVEYIPADELPETTAVHICTLHEQRLRHVDGLGGVGHKSLGHHFNMPVPPGWEEDRQQAAAWQWVPQSHRKNYMLVPKDDIQPRWHTFSGILTVPNYPMFLLVPFKQNYSTLFTPEAICQVAIGVIQAHPWSDGIMYPVYTPHATPDAMSATLIGRMNRIMSLDESTKNTTVARYTFINDPDRPHYTTAMRNHDSAQFPVHQQLMRQRGVYRGPELRK